jgi:hypothetical protein
MLPLAAQIMGPLLTRYGFRPDQTGLMQLALAGAPYKDDEELVALGRAMREKFVPPEMLPMLNAMMGMGLPPIQFPGMPGPPQGLGGGLPKPPGA